MHKFFLTTRTEVLTNGGIWETHEVEALHINGSGPLETASKDIKIIIVPFEDPWF